MEKKQNIKCNVYDCKFCDVDKISCNLKEIKISNCNHKNNKDSTMCDSYKTTKGIKIYLLNFTFEVKF